MKISTTIYFLLLTVLSSPIYGRAQYFYQRNHLFQIGHRENVNEVKWSPDNTKILSHSSPDNSLRLWDVKTGQQLWSVNTGFVQRSLETYTLNSFDWSSDGHLIASTGYNGKVQLWDATSGKLIWMVDAYKEEAQVVRFSPDNKYLLTIAQDDGSAEQMKLWNVESGKLITAFKGKFDNPIAATFSEDGKHVKVGCSGGRTYLWDLQLGKQIASPPFKPCGNLRGGFRDSGFSPDLSLFVGRCGERSVIIDTRTGKVVRVLRMRTDFQAGVGFSSDGKTLALSDLDGYLILNLSTGRIGKIADSINSGFTYELSGDGKLIAEGGGFGAEGVKVSEVASGKVISRLESHPGIIYSLAFSADGSRFASGSSDRVLRIWDTNTHEILFALEGHTDEIRSVEFSLDGSHITSISPKEKILWNAKTGTRETVTKAESEISNEFKEKVTSPDGELKLEDMGDDAPFKLTDAKSGNIIKEFSGLTQIQGFKFTPDSKYFLSAAWFYPLQLWDVQSGSKLRDFDIGYSDNNVLAFSPDGKRFVTGGWNQNILMYDVKSGERLWSLFPIDQLEMDVARGHEDRRIKFLKDKADAEKRADKNTATYREKVYITFEHYGDATDPGELRMLESGRPNKSKIKKAPDSANAVWLRLHNDSPLPIEIPTQSMYLPNPKCSFNFTNGTKTLGLCEGQEISVWHGLEDKNGNSIPYGFDFGSSATLLPKTSVLFAVPLNILSDGNSIVFDYKFQNINDEGKVDDYGSDITMKFNGSNLPLNRGNNLNLSFR